MTLEAKELDKYYTKKCVVDKCLSSLGDMSAYDFIIEPSAGGGAFYNKINYDNKIGMDVAPDGDGIKKRNWLKYSVPSKFNNVLVIGNPPFGKMNALSTDFIKHALSFANVSTIGFILPNVYKKHTRQRILPGEWRIKSITDIGNNAFELGGDTKHVPCSFFVFDKSAGRDFRTDPDKYKYKVDFTFGNSGDFDLFLFGAAPKRIILNPKPNNRGHFIKSKIPVETLWNRLLAIDWKGNSCANGGVFWLTQAEVLEQYYNAFYG